MKALLFHTLALILLLPLPGCSGRAGRENGKSVQAWIRQYQSSSVDSRRLEAIEALAASLKAGAPAGARPDKDVTVALESALRDRDAAVRLAAAAALAWVGQENGLTVPVLLEGLRDGGAEALRGAVEEALTYRDRASESALGVLQEQIQAMLPDFAPLAVSGREHALPEQAAALVAGAEARLADPSEKAVLAALDALGRLGPHAAPAVGPLAKVLKNPNARLRTAALETLGRLGTVGFNSFFRVADCLNKDSDPGVRRAAAEVMMRLHPSTGGSVYYLYTALGSDGDAGVREAAARCLGDFGPVAKEADNEAVEPELLKAKVWPRTLALRMIGPAVPVLLKALKDDAPGVRAAAARTLGRVSPDAGKVIPGLLSACGDADAGVRAAAAAALGELPGTTAECAAKLEALSRDPAPPVRAEAILALARTARGMGGVLPIMEAATSDADPQVQVALLRSMEMAGGGAVRARKTLSAALGRLAQSPDARVRAQAARTMGRCELDSARAVQALAGALTDKDDEVARAAVQALAGMGAAAGGAITELEKAASQGAATLRPEAALALGWIDFRSTRTLERMAGVMQAPGYWREGLLVLGWRGPQAWPAAPLAAGILCDRENPAEARLLAGMALVAMTSDTVTTSITTVFQESRTRTAGRRLQAATGLLWLGERAAPALPELMRVVLNGGEEPELRAAAAAAVGGMGKAAAGQVPALCELLGREPEGQVKAALVAVLGGLGDPAARGPLTAALRDEAPEVREAAALALGRMAGAKAGPEVIAALGGALGDGQPRVRLAAARALAGCGAAARTAQSALEGLASGDADRLVRQTAAATLKKISGK